MNSVLHDLRFGLRMLAKNPGFTAAAIITLALGLGATTAIFSVVHGVLLRRLPYPNPDQVVSIRQVAGDGHLMRFTDPDFADLRAANHSFAGMAKCTGGEETVVDSAGPARVNVQSVSADFFRVMGVSPLVGRGFSPEELRQGGTPAALVSYGYWQQHFGAATDLSPFKLKQEGQLFSVVGVLPPGFDFPSHTDVWMPAEFFGDQSASRTSHNWPLVVGRLRDGVTLSQARSELSTLARGLYQQYKPYIDMHDVSVMPLRAALTASVRPALLMLLGAVAFLLLVACANVANLLLARAAERRRELVIRSALGAGRAQIIRQFLVETLILSLAGGALGIVIAAWGVNGLLALAPPDLPRLNEVSIDLPVLAFVLGVLVLVAVVLGVATAIHATSGNPQEALVEGGRGAAGSLATQRLGRSLVAGQLAITLILLTGTGLLARSLLHVLSVNPGFSTARIATMEFEVPGGSSHVIGPGPLPGEPAAFVNTLFDRLRNVPGVEQVGGASHLPLTEGGLPNGTFLLIDRQPDLKALDTPEGLKRFESLWHTAPSIDANYCVASEGYFKVLGIPLLRGRLFDERDTADAPHVALVSQSLARSTWPNQNPIGRTIEFGNMDGDLRLATVVGVVGDVRNESLERKADQVVYSDYRQRLQGSRDFTVVMRTSLPANVLLPEARRELRSLDPSIAPRFETFRDVFSAALGTRRFNLILIGAFAATALLLAAVGIHGVMAYWVVRRTREIAVRVALGASAGDVLHLVLGQGFVPTVAGVAVGIGGSLLLTHAMQSMLFGVGASDPVTLAGVALLLTLVALTATYIPARRATKVDPVVALRHE